MNKPNSNNAGADGRVRLSYSVLIIKSKKHGLVEVKFDKNKQQIINKHVWSVTKIGNNLYAVTTIKGKTQYMHRILTEYKYSLVDHKNKDSLDNRLINLRKATKSINSFNQKSQRKDMPTGVHFRKSSGRYFCRFNHNKKVITVGTFDTIEDAVKARVEAMKNAQIKL